MLIDCILFDLGNVLLFHDAQRRLRALADFTGQSPQAIGEFLSLREISDELDLGHTDAGGLSAALGELAGRPVTQKDAMRLWLSVFEPNLDLWHRLPKLGERHSLGVFSNNPPFIRQIFPHTTRFDQVLLSSQFGAMKPDIAVFKAVQASLSYPPEHVLFVDDKRENIEQAFSIGWNAIEFHSNDALATDFVRLGLS